MTAAETETQPETDYALAQRSAQGDMAAFERTGQGPKHVQGRRRSGALELGKGAHRALASQLIRGVDADFGEYPFRLHAQIPQITDPELQLARGDLARAWRQPGSPSVE